MGTQLHFVPAALCALAVLSSCNRWNMGGYIQDSYITSKGVDVDNPVDGKVYRAGQGKNTAYYMLAPEITYHPCHKVLASRDLKYSEWEETYPRGVRRTGKQRWVKIGAGGVHFLKDRHGREVVLPELNCPWRYIKDVDQLPAHAAPLSRHVCHRQRRQTRDYAEEPVSDRSRSFPARLLAAPFNYVIDPVLSVGTDAAHFALGLAVSPVAIIWGMLDNPPEVKMSPEVQELLPKANIIELSCDRDDGFIICELSEYIDVPTVKSGSKWYFSSRLKTWLEELPYILDKRRPCILVMDRRSRVPEQKERQVVEYLQAHGLTVYGTLKERRGSTTMTQNCSIQA